MIGKKGHKDYIFVGAQFVLFTLYLFPLDLGQINLGEWLMYPGIIMLISGIILALIALFQLNTRLSPFPTPVKNGKLITTGAFSFSRHPIYTGLILITLGYALFRLSIFRILIGILLAILLFFKSIYEEELLSKKFPQYIDYTKKTGRFF